MYNKLLAFLFLTAVSAGPLMAMDKTSDTATKSESAEKESAPAPEPKTQESTSNDNSSSSSSSSDNETYWRQQDEYAKSGMSDDSCVIN